jgi:hypothetical protein
MYEVTHTIEKAIEYIRTVERPGGLVEGTARCWVVVEGRDVQRDPLVAYCTAGWSSAGYESAEGCRLEG